MADRRHAPVTLAVLALALSLGLASSAGAVVTSFTDRAEFLTFTGARQLNEPYPGGPSSAAEFLSGSVSFRAPSGSSINFAQWTSAFPGFDLALNGRENLDVEISAPVASIGFELIEDGAPSTFSVRLLRDGTEVGSESFTTSGGTRFFGIWTHTPFDRIEIREGAGDQTNEFFGSFFGGSARNRDLSSNTPALVCQFPLLGVYAFAFGAGLVAPPPLDTAFGLTAFSSNLALKFCQPWAEAPPDIVTYADDPDHPDPDSPAACFRSFEHERVHSTSTYLFGFPVDYDWSWGELGTPQVIHFNSDVEVYLQRGLSPPFVDDLSLAALLGDELAAGGIYSDCDDLKETSDSGHLCPFAEDRTLAFPVGRGGVGYRFDVNMGLLDFVYVPVPGFPHGTKNKALKDFALNVLVEVAQITWDLALGGWRFGNFVDRQQQVIVYDLQPPRIDKAVGDFNGDGQTNAADQAFIDDVVIEADEPGGVSARRYEGFLRSMFETSDACGRSVGFGPIYPDEARQVFWPVSTEAASERFQITWQARDPGPNEDGLANVVTRAQSVEVVDTRPPIIQPPPDIVEVTSENQVTLDLGQPLVFDLVDLEPTIVNDAVFPLGPGLHTITWTATDASGNAASAEQTVNIKNDNLAPDAIAQAGGDRIDAVSFEPVDIVLEGFDPDADPLSFFIEDYPGNGFFIAPLYPYFIEDYRLQATMGEADIEQLCEDLPTAGSDFFHLEEIRAPEYFSVLDDGTTYVMDYGYIQCREDLQLPPRTLLRIAVFDAEGRFINARNRDDFPDDFYIDPLREQVYTTFGEISRSSVSVLDSELDPVRFYNLFSMRDREGVSKDIPFANSAVIDSNGVIYIVDTLGEVHAVDASTPGEASVRPTYLGLVLQTSNQGQRFDMAIDSQDNVYVAMKNRVYKITPSTVDESGEIVLGSLAGWLGRCTADFAPGDQAVCDVANERSLGYACTDETCGGNGPGGGPGQFDDARGIAMDPNDVLYVTDYENFRVQRFTPEGFFAGQAESACEGNCFVLGDFGRPSDIAVNSNHFFILDPDTELLHVSQTSPFLELGDDFARLRYQSNNDFACVLSADCVDSFTFSVSDGVRDPDTGQPLRSAPAPVQVEVARNFRAPFATPDISAVVSEEVPTAITLDGSDPDPLDALSFAVTRPPAHGRVSLSGNQATYTSNIDFVGEDRFAFTVDDGQFTSAPETVAITVTDVNDPAVLSFDTPITVARGFEVRLEGTINDPDPEDRHLLVVRWNDGSPDEPEGRIDMMGKVTGPLLMQTASGSGTVMASHLFQASGQFDVEFCATDRVAIENGDKTPTAQSIESCRTVPVTVEDQVDLSLEVERPPALVRGESSDYRLTVENRRPDSGSGLSATGLELIAEIDPVLITAPPGGCSIAGSTITCTLPDLAPGASQALTIPIIVPGDPGPIASVDSELRLLVREPTVKADNRVLVSTPVVFPADFIIGGAGPDELADDPDLAPGDGQCAGAATGACNLRAAVMEANALAGRQVVSLGNQVYTLTLTDPASPDPGYGDLDVRGHLVINGNGPDRSFIDAGGIDRAFDVEPGAILELVGLSITGGLPSEEDAGGAIRVQNGGRLVLRNVHVFGNDAPGAGGAILDESTVAESLVIENATISANTGSAGAGIVTRGNARLTNVTLSANRSSGEIAGGAIRFDGGTHQLTHVTVVSNSAAAGGGIAVEGGATVDLVNTLVAGNSAGSGPDCAAAGGVLRSGGGNLLGDLSGCDLAPRAGDVFGLDPRVGELRDNGGPAPTHALDAASPARDGALDAPCPPVDQRGEPRPADGVGNGQARCDIGAFEASAVPFQETIFESSFE